jgi:RimJ/RimL family protein N-acetyltransferase
LTWEQHHAWFARYVEKPDDVVFVVESVESGARVGQVAIYAIDEAVRKAEIGRFVVAPEYQGRGLMRKAIAALLRLAAQEFNLASVYLEVIETNVRARRLYEALGFVETGAGNGLLRMERGVDANMSGEIAPRS